MIKNYIYISAVSFVVLLAVIYGFWVVSPFKTKDIREDQAKVTDVANIKNAITNYYRTYKKLPDQLVDLHSTNPTLPINDSSTNAPYAYSITGAVNYSICSDFQTDSSESSGPSYNYYAAYVTLNHPKGHYCYSFDATR